MKTNPSYSGESRRHTAKRSYGLLAAGLTALVLSALAMTSCRQESDPVMNYAYNDQMAFGAAENSYAAKFDVLWNGMNTNYAMWDYEEQFGVDWDQVYDEFYPQFAALDSQKTAVTDAQLKALLDSVLAPLHDGHMLVSLKNHATGKFVNSSPAALRMMRERRDEYLSVTQKGIDSLSYTYYREAGEILEERYICTNALSTVVGPALTTVGDLMEPLKEKERQGTITPEESDTLKIYTEINTEIQRIIALLFASGDDSSEAVAIFNTVAYRYEYLHIPGLVPVDPLLAQYGMTLSYVLFKGNIAYLAFDQFMLSAYLNEEIRNSIFGTPSESTQLVIDHLTATWQAWFNAIQTHQKAGDLGGVIIDVRNNGGGILNDYQYVLGALLPSGNYHNTNARFKRGTGRLDYSPIMPQLMPTYSDEHVTVTAPVVTLCNVASVSMAEHTSYGTTTLDNGTLIGTRTWGGFSALNSGEVYTNNYAGYVGIQNVTPVFCYIPLELAMTKDNEVLEGKGVTPDIEVAWDENMFMTTGRDNQLDRALQFIKGGN